MVGQMNIREMIQIVHRITGMTKKQVQVIGHEVRQEYEYIDYYDLMEKSPRPRHRLRKINDRWKAVY